MSQTVKCAICGGVYNQRYLSSHKRMSHGQNAVTSSKRDDAETLEMIVSLYAELRDETKKEVRNRLANADENGS